MVKGLIEFKPNQKKHFRRKYFKIFNETYGFENDCIVRDQIQAQQYRMPKADSSEFMDWILHLLNSLKIKSESNNLAKN